MDESITQLLDRYGNGDTEALDALTAQLYPELKRLAHSRARHGSGIGATTLVQETFVKLLSGKQLRPADRKEFFAVAATLMRQIVVDGVRYAAAQKRAGLKVSLTDVASSDEDLGDHIDYLLNVDRVLNTLQVEDARLAKVFECRYFAGLTTVETAECMDLSQRTAERLWSSARQRVGELISD